jgi:branched-chain amino acid transport system ATP-binding protein
MALLETRGLTKQFGGLVALDDVSVEIDSGELVGLIGPNGAGKTTFFNCATGFLRPTAGEVYFDGERITDLSPEDRARRGMVRSFQTPRALPTLSVRENVMLAAADHPGERTLPALLDSSGAREYEADIRARADELLAQFDMADRAEEYAGRLSGGERKILEIVRGLMLDPEILMLDEPYAGVDGETVAEISGYIEDLNDDGMTFLIIEHGLESLVELVDRLIVLNEGGLLIDDTTEAVVEDERVINVYTGKPIEA